MHGNHAYICRQPLHVPIRVLTVFVDTACGAIMFVTQAHVDQHIQSDCLLRSPGLLPKGGDAPAASDVDGATKGRRAGRLMLAKECVV